MATERAAKLFPTAGDAHRYCKTHGLDISMVSDQLWDIAEALYDASNAGQSKNDAERLSPETIVEWAKDIEARHGTDNAAGNVEELIADAVMEAWEWIRVNERGQHPTSVPPELHQKILDASNLIVKELPGVDARKELDGLQDVMTWLRENK